MKTMTANDAAARERDPGGAIPTIAIVGHPNKGKSSIVSTLAHDSKVAISAHSGTTTASRSFPMLVDGRELYRLVDTPGFQRARATIDWMQKHSISAADHSEIVRQFVETHRGGEQFAAECELLTPIIAGAGILYVVDGSVPYGPEYEAEMEVLRWTGQPSMALINQIGQTEYFEQWRDPLSQYFKIVRVFNAQTASFDKQIKLLSGFSELSERWHGPLQEAVNILVTQRQQRIDQAVDIITSTLTNMLTLTHTRTVHGDDNSKEVDGATERFKNALRDLEQRMRKDIEQLFNFHRLQRDEAALAVLSEDLFSDRTWQIFGLSRDQLVTTGMIGGAAGGTLLDIGSGGLTMLLGTGLGAVLGGAGAWFGSKRLVGSRVLGLPVGGNQLVIGPVTNLNFPWIVLARAVGHLRLLIERTHARRDQLTLSPDQQGASSMVEQMDSDTRKALQKAFSHAGKQGEITEADRGLLRRTVKELALANSVEATTVTTDQLPE